MKKTIQILAWTLIVLGGLISIFFIISTYFDGFSILSSQKTDYGITGQFGDFIGGVVGTIFALAGTLLIFLTFNEQVKQNKREAFESAFFEMIRLYRQNVTELTYEKFVSNKLDKAENRKVFRHIFQEFLECFREVKKFSNSKNPDDYLLKRQKEKLMEIINSNNQKINIIELALIDIAYSIVYFGVGEEGEIVLRDKFKKKYRHEYFYPLLKFIKLKPRRPNKIRWEKWEKLLSYPFKQFKDVNKEFYAYREHMPITSVSAEVKNLIYKTEYDKYYGGHQHRLGHYYRHLFQSYKYLNYHKELTLTEKKFYGKTLRAQISTYEQALLFVNSLSSLGMKWEFTPEFDLLDGNEDKENCKLITRYNLIKNLPGNHFFGLTYKTYYPKIDYENTESS